VGKYVKARYYPRTFFSSTVCPQPSCVHATCHGCEWVGELSWTDLQSRRIGKSSRLFLLLGKNNSHEAAISKRQGKGTNQCPTQSGSGSEVTESVQPRHDGTPRQWNGRGFLPFIESTLLFTGVQAASSTHTAITHRSGIEWMLSWSIRSSCMDSACLLSTRVRISV
jgi:hypothetical protein